MVLLYSVCVFFPSILDIKFVGRTSRGHTGFLIHLPSAVRALIFVARRIQPFLSLVDREVEFCVLPNNRSPPVGHFYFGFLVFSEKNSVCRDRTHVPMCQKVTRCLLSYRGRPACILVDFSPIFYCLLKPLFLYGSMVLLSTLVLSSYNVLLQWLCWVMIGGCAW